jgi:non-ribosomal peptide synthetase component F
MSGAANDVLVRLDSMQKLELQKFAAAQGVSLNTVVAGAWVLWLGRQLGSGDVVFGIAAAGRPADIVGVDRLVGVTINNLPLRVSLTATTVRDWLRELQARQGLVSQFAHTPLERIQGWSGVSWKQRLFDSILVFQHASAEEDNSAWLGADVQLSPMPVATHTAYPLSLVVGGGDTLDVRISSDPALVAPAQAAAAGEGLLQALRALTSSASRTVTEALAALPEPRLSQESRSSLRVVREHVPPRTATHAVLSRLMGDLLEEDGVGITEDFFALGGNSLVATQLASRIRDTLRVEIPVRLVFANPSVEQLARALTERERVAGQLERVAALVQRVETMSIDELRQAGKASAAQS